MRCPSESVDFNCAEMRALLTEDQPRADHFNRSTKSMASATQAPSRMPTSAVIAGYQPSLAVSTSAASRTAASIPQPSENPTPLSRQAAANP
jgi:hypothetical protein